MRSKMILAAVSALAMAGAVQAANVIDQNASTNNAYMAGFQQTGLAQSFQQTANNVSGAGIFLQGGVGSTDTVTISLWTALPNVLGATQLATASGTGTAGSWFDVFWSPVSVATATTYYLVFTGNTSLGISGDTNNGYAFGDTFANSGFSSFPGFDYTFRTYADDQFSAVVPEPASWAMLIAGFGLVGAVARRRRISAAA